MDEKNKLRHHRPYPSPRGAWPSQELSVQTSQQTAKRCSRPMQLRGVAGRQRPRVWLPVGLFPELPCAHQRKQAPGELHRLRPLLPWAGRPLAHSQVHRRAATRRSRHCTSAGHTRPPCMGLVLRSWVFIDCLGTCHLLIHRIVVIQQLFPAGRSQHCIVHMIVN